MSHTCHNRACGAPCPPRHLCCARCWAFVPNNEQREVYATVGRRRRGSPDETWAPWWRAQAYAIHSAMVVGAGRGLWREAFPGDFQDELDRCLEFANYLDGTITGAELTQLRDARARRREHRQQRPS